MSRPTASTSIDFPAPVSPVRTLRPGLEFDLDRIDDGEVLNAKEAKHLEGWNSESRRSGQLLWRAKAGTPMLPYV